MTNVVWTQGRWTIVENCSEFYLQRPGWTVAATLPSAEEARHWAEKISLLITEQPTLGWCDDCGETIEEVPRTKCECGRRICEDCCLYVCDICGQHWCGDCLQDLYHEHIKDWKPLDVLPEVDVDNIFEDFWPDLENEQ